MINAEKRIVQLGDGDVKIAYCELGIAFGDASIPDSNNIEDDYIFGLHLSYRDVIAINDLLDDIVDKKDKEFTYLNTTFKFSSKSDVEAIRNVLISWFELSLQEVKNLENYLAEKGIGYKKIESED